MRTCKKRNFRKGRKGRKSRKCGGKGSSSKKSSSGNKEVELQTFKRSGKGLKQMTKDKFIRASKKASNVRFLRKEASKAEDRALQAAHDKWYGDMENQGRFAGH